MFFFCVFSHTRDVPELSATMYGIQDNEDISDVQSIVNAGKKLATAQCLLDALENIYCGSMSVEFMHMKVICQSNDALHLIFSKHCV